MNDPIFYSSHRPARQYFTCVVFLHIDFSPSPRRIALAGVDSAYIVFKVFIVGSRSAMQLLMSSHHG